MSLRPPRTFGAKTGCCNICGTFGALTYDHVPPQGSVDPQRVHIRSLAQTLEIPKDQHIVRLSQNGVKFRSLCSHCNNERLGRRYDPALNHFSRQITRMLRARERIILPSRVPIVCRPHRLAQAVIGHLLAVDIREDMASPPRKAPMRDDMRTFFLDESMDLPPKLHLYFWPYAAVRQTILSGVGLLSGGHTIVGDFLKYFPVAFWLAYEAPDEITEVLRNRELLVRGCGIDSSRPVLIPTRPRDTFRPDWPEAPDDHEALLINDGSCYVAQKAGG